MESRAKFLGHPIHPMLIVFPLGLLVTSFIFDIIYLSTDNSTFAIASFYMIAAGIIGGLLAAVFGVVDFLAIPKRTRAYRVGLAHGLGNVIVLGLFAISWWLRRPNPEFTENVPIIISFLGVAVGAVTGWLGGELVDRLGVGVDPGAHINAPSSLEQEKIPPGSRDKTSDIDEPRRVKPSA